MKGSYKFIQNKKIILEATNIITLQGKAFFLNRCVNNNLSVIDKIGLGKGVIDVSEKDTKLNSLKVMKRCNPIIDVKNNKITFSAVFKPSELANCSEIGLFASDKLITHDVFESLQVNNSKSNITIEYMLNFNAGTTRTDFKKKEDTEGDIYYIYESATVIAVYDEMNTAYTHVDSVEKLVMNSFFYDSSTKNLYFKKEEGVEEITIIIK